jgi:hypothetical protein
LDISPEARLFAWHIWRRRGTRMLADVDAAKLLGVSVSTVKRLRAELVTAGMVTWKKPHNGPGRVGPYQPAGRYDRLDAKKWKYANGWTWDGVTFKDSDGLPALP